MITYTLSNVVHHRWNRPGKGS